MAEGRPAELSLANLFTANRPELTTPEIFAIHRGIDVILGLLLIFNFMRSIGIFFSEDGGMSFSISGPLITRPFLEAVLEGIGRVSLDSVSVGGRGDG